jgi:hypothetical protein
MPCGPDGLRMSCVGGHIAEANDGEGAGQAAGDDLSGDAAFDDTMLSSLFSSVTLLPGCLPNLAIAVTVGAGNLSRQGGGGSEVSSYGKSTQRRGRLSSRRQ